MQASLRSPAHFIQRHERTASGSVMNEAVLNKLERRLGRLHARLRLGIEMDHEAQIFGQGINFFHIENWCSVHSVGLRRLGNHDTIRMVPGLEEMGIRMLLNECERILRGDQVIYLAGIDDAHYYRVDNIEKAASEIPDNGFSILLSHTPEIYRQAAHGGFDLLVSGHTHGGQICLPGSIPITLDSVLPRHMGSGPWKHRDMVGYTSVGVGTSVVPVRINCLPEITLHHLQCW